VLLGYRYSYYNLVDMRIHDINVVADLAALDPNAPEPCDGSRAGIVTSTDSNNYDTDATQAALQYLSVTWTGPWPLLHLIVLNPANLAIVLLHITVDLIGNIGLVSLIFLEWFLGLFGVSPDAIAYILGLIYFVLDAAAIWAIGLAFNSMVAAYMAFDATGALLVAGVATGLYILTIALTYVFSNAVADQLGDLVWAGCVWLGLLYLIIRTFFGCHTGSLTGDMQDAASALFAFACDRLGYSSGTKIGVSFGIVTKVALIALAALCVAVIWHYFNLAA